MVASFLLFPLSLVSCSCSAKNGCIGLPADHCMEHKGWLPSSFFWSCLFFLLCFPFLPPISPKRHGSTQNPTTSLYGDERTVEAPLLAPTAPAFAFFSSFFFFSVLLEQDRAWRPVGSKPQRATARSDVKKKMVGSFFFQFSTSPLEGLKRGASHPQRETLYPDDPSGW